MWSCAKNATLDRVVVRFLGSAVLAALSTPAMAGVTLDADGHFTVYGDFRARLEADWDSESANGSSRDDRNRARIRARVGFAYENDPGITLGLRLRTGSDMSHQSPHITVVDFDDNDTGDADVNLDKWFLQKTFDGGHEAWIGRNSVPMWKQNELLWDDDVTPAGLAYRYEAESFGINLGYFSMPVGMREFSGNLGLVQVVANGKVGEAAVTGAAGYLGFDADANDADGVLLLDGNGMRDYGIWTVSGQATFQVNDRPVRLGVDYYHNSESYSVSDPDSFTALHRDEDSGWVVSGQYGGTSPGGWLFGYYYAHVETFGVNSSFSQDDWMRWGSATETRSSNFKGHEIRVAHGLSESMNIVARLYVVDAVDRRSAGALAKEDGNRFRIDLNFKF